MGEGTSVCFGRDRDLLREQTTKDYVTKTAIILATH
jgi:hypothetical protein